MREINAHPLAGYSAALDALTEGQRASLVEVVFCFRNGTLSATAVFGDVGALREVAGQVPAEIEGAVSKRYGVDLESLAEGRARFYIDGNDPETVLLGFTYSAVGQLEEWKRYRRDPECKERLLVDRFDATTGDAKSIGEVERAGEPDLWKGPLELPEKAKRAGRQVIYLAKETKDQSYLRVFPS